MEGNDEGWQFAIYNFSPTAGESFKVGLIYFFFSFSFQSFVQKKPIFWPKEIEITSKGRPVMIPYKRTVQNVLT